MVAVAKIPSTTGGAFGSIAHLHLSERLVKARPNIVIWSALLLTVASYRSTQAAPQDSTPVPATATPAPTETPVPWTPREKKVADLVQATLKDTPSWQNYDVFFPPATKLVSVADGENGLIITFNEYLSRRIWTQENADALVAKLRETLGTDINTTQQLDVRIRYGAGKEARTMALNDHILSSELIHERQAAKTGGPVLAAPIVQRVSYAGPKQEKGLAGRNIVVSASHGWTWHQENRWQYQRARVFTIVEDLYPQSFVNPFLIPMLENAGANVWSVRERDYQTAEVIVDNDAPGDSTFTTTGTWATGAGKGWRGGRPAALGPMDQPFTLGTTVKAEVTDSDISATAVYAPFVPRAGRYAVYLSWSASPENSSSVPVIVHHAGGETRFAVNQQAGGNTWVFLDFFQFNQTDIKKGPDAEHASVTIVANGAKRRDGGPTFITADAVRFGGGMGNIAPEDMVSYKPRYAEAAMYFLQYAGAPPDMVYRRSKDPGHFGEDYNSDITSRGEWPNFLNGAPDGPNDVTKDGEIIKQFRNSPGLGVPIDLKFGWHTDAGHEADGIVGTLDIYSLIDDAGQDHFPDGRSRFLNRDLTSLVQEEIMRTAKTEYSSTWARRAVHDRGLGETRRPNVPSTLLEVVSHHNFHDMQYGNDPRFRRDIARAVYKGITRFLADSNGTEVAIQPLAPLQLSAVADGAGNVRVSWIAQPDALESTANPDGYILYSSTDGISFDNGALVKETTTGVAVPENTARYFRVTAVNAGGQSLPSAVVGARWKKDEKPVLIVDGFDRIAPPAVLYGPHTRGFDRSTDAGVGYGYSYALVGDQYDFDPDSEWKNDLESPGKGASQSSHETTLEKGNTFDHIVDHGAALGVAFDSATADAFAAGSPKAEYWLIDWIAGEQKTTMPPVGLTEEGKPDRMKPEFPVLTAQSADRLAAHVAAGRKLVMSGAHIGADLTTGALASTSTKDFATKTLGIAASHPFATRINQAIPPDAPIAPAFKDLKPLRFGRDLEEAINILPTVYDVESAEAFDKSDGRVLLTYGDTGTPAAITRPNVVVFGFPLETVMPPEQRNALFAASVAYLKQQ